jgi:hypothetical protein
LKIVGFPVMPTIDQRAASSSGLPTSSRGTRFSEADYPEGTLTPPTVLVMPDDVLLSKCKNQV